VQLKNGILALNNLSMNALKGTIQMTGTYNSTDIKQPLANFAMNLTSIDIPTTFNAFNTIQAIAPIAKKCTGNITVAVSLNTTLDHTLSPVLNTLDATGQLRSANIGMSDAKVFNLIADKLKNEKYRNPALRNVDVKFKIEDGNLTIAPFDVSIADSKARISGSQNLDQTIDYHIATQIQADKAADLFGKATKLNLAQKIDLDISIGNTLTDPQITGLKSKALGDVKEQVTEQVKEKVEELVTNVKKEASEKAKKIIADADREAQKIIAEAEIKAEQIRQNAAKLADATVKEADEQGKKLIKEAGSNPIAKKAAEKAAEKLNKEAAEKAEKINKEANDKANQVLETTKTEAANIKKQAQEQADKLN